MGAPLRSRGQRQMRPRVHGVHAIKARISASAWSHCAAIVASRWSRASPTGRVRQSGGPGTRAPPWLRPRRGVQLPRARLPPPRPVSGACRPDCRSRRARIGPRRPAQGFLGLFPPCSEVRDRAEGRRRPRPRQGGLQAVFGRLGSSSCRFRRRSGWRQGRLFAGPRPRSVVQSVTAIRIPTGG